MLRGIALTSALAFLATGSSASAQSERQPVDGPTDPIYTAYMRVYAGDPDDAFRQFDALHQRDAQSLPAWFGRLFAHHSRIEVDDSLAPAFETDIAAFLNASEQRHARNRNDAAALFYLAQGYLLRGIYRFEFDKGVWGAARDAAKAKGYADQYIKLYPGHGDAYLALGLYNYFVDIAPNFVKVFRALLFLPSGNRAEGLKQIERAAREGSLLAPLADTALVEIYGSLEGRLADAIPIAERYIQRFPGSANGRMDLAQIYAHPNVEAYDRAAEQYTAVIAAASGSSLRHLSERHRAIQGLAALRRAQWRLEDAIALLTPIIEHPVEKPAWVLPNFLLQRGNYRLLLNDPRAGDDAKRVLGDARMARWHKPAQQQLSVIEAWRRTDEGAVYTALIPGNRLVVEDRWDEASSLYQQVAASRPGNWQVRYRLAYLEFARGNYAASAQGMEALVAPSARIPAWLKAAALLNLANSYDILGRRPEALRLYKRIVDDFENESPVGAARIGLITPYRGKIKKN
jgi:hypothetical protein